ncbi:hypothetical protein EDC19_1697 [Natranaerovirga hydrolytica]|uniref:Uncharacterized protein n=1 Tax=Natranaerovirga hydrolytica TaxID=680378 RepID=A0A4R1MRM0_9FIRM|nr:hypothetical protein [Natranaerovirga hydrolytica]TCK92553.1 hypothetical protein EDC19_1697 [Natranaerovirga hydrolytica]
MKVFKKDNIILCLIIGILLLSLTGCEKEVIDPRNVMMENGLTFKETQDYTIYYKVGSNPPITTFDSLEEAGEVEFFADLLTEMFIPIFNFLLFDRYLEGEESTDWYQDAREVGKKYGITRENRLTSEWVVENAYEAYHMMVEIPRSDLMYSELMEKYESYFLKEDIEKNGLTLLENIMYAYLYELGCDVEILYVDSQTEYLDGTQELEFYISDETEELLELTNYIIWEYEPEDAVEIQELSNSRGRIQAQGLSEDNRFTSEWVINNPYEAYNAMRISLFFWNSDNYKKIYEQHLQEQ